MANRFLNNIRINDEYTLPAADGSADQIITTDGAGQLSFADLSSIDGASSNFVYFDVKNETGSLILKGKGVMAVGTDGNSGHILIDEMVADGSVESKYFLGVLEEDIPNGGFARVISFGQLSQFNTNGQNGETWADGQVLWCDPANNGDFTITEPDGPNVKIAAAFILNSSTNGKIQVRVQANEGIHDLHDTKITSQVDGDVLVWKDTEGIWQNDSTLNVDYAAGNVGIGTTSPANRLHVAGTTQVDNGAINFGGTSSVVGSNPQLRRVNSSNDLGIATGGSDRITVLGTGNVGIGTTSPSQKLQVEGNSWIKGVYYDTSGDAGASGQVLSSTTTGTNWITLNDIYYTESESDSRFVNVAGDTMTGTLNYRMLQNQTTGNYDTAGDASGFSVFYADASATNKPSGVDHAVATFSYSDLWQTQLAMDWRTNSAYLRTQENGTWKGWNQLFTDGYHPNADTWTTGRTITIGNTGKSVNGSANVSWTLSEIGAAAASHNHDDRYYTETESDGRFVNVTGDTMTGDLTLNNSGQGWIKGYDDYHSIKFRAGGANKTEYYEYGGTLAAELGHKFFTGGTTGQTLKFQVADDGSYFSGNVGIGVVPADRNVLDVRSDNTNGVFVTHRNNNGFFLNRTYADYNNDGTTVEYQERIGVDGNLSSIGNFSNHTLGIRTNNQDRITVLANGNVGIGTTSPVTALHIKSATEGMLHLDSSGNTASVQFRDNGNIRGLIGFSNGSSIYTGADNHDMVFRSEAKVHIVSNTSNHGITISSGNVGIGTTSPDTKLDVAGRAVIGTGNTLLNATNATVIGNSNNLTNDSIVDANTNLVLGDYGAGRYGNTVISDRTLRLGRADNITATSSNTTGILNFNDSVEANSAFSNVGGLVGYFPPPTTTNDYYFISAFSENVNGSAFQTGASPTASRYNMSTSPSLSCIGQKFDANTTNGGAVYITASNNSPTPSSRGIFTFDARHQNQNYTVPDGHSLFEVTSGYGQTKFLIKQVSGSTNVGIGTTSPNDKLHVAGGVYSTSIGNPIDGQIGAIQMGYDGTAGRVRTWNSSPLIYSTYNYQSWETQGGERMRITTAGNVGIGTTSPSQKLEVSGNAYFTGQSQASNAVMKTHSGHAIFGSNSTTVPVALGRDAANLDLVVSTSGNVGIGTTSPGGRLELNGSGQSWSTAPAIRMWDSYNSKGWLVGNVNNITAGDFYIRTLPGEDTNPGVSNNEFTIKHATGNVGIGTTSPSAKLDIVGTVNASQGYSTNNTSRKYFWRTNNTANSGLLWKKIGTYNSIGQSSRIMITATGTTGYGAGAKPGKMTIIAQVNNNNLLEGSFWQEGMSAQYGSVGFISNSATSHDIYYQVGSFAEYAYEAIISDGTFIPDSTTASTPSFTHTPERSWNVNNNLLVNSSGNVGIGTTSPVDKLHVEGGGIRATGGTSNGKSIRLYVNDSWGYLTTSASRFYLNTEIRVDSGLIGSYDESLQLRTSGTTRMYIDNSNGNVGIGTTSPQEKLHVQNYTTGESHQAMFKGGGINVGDYSYISLNNGYSTEYNKEIRLAAVAELGASNKTGFAILTSPDSNGASGHERLRVTADGNVGIGTTNMYARLSVRATSHNNGISVNRAADTTAAIYIGNDGGNNPILAANNADMIFGKDLSGTFTEYARIKNGGNVGIGTTSPSEKLHVSGYAGSTTGFKIINSYGSPTLNAYYNVFTTSTVLYVGTVFTGEACFAASFNITSDYRLKENIVTLTGAIDKVKNLNPVSFNFKNTERTVNGFIAHEVQDVIPEAVTGDKDALYEDGKEKYQGLDNGKIVPLLTAALQEAITKIESLEARIQILENQ